MPVHESSGQRAASSPIYNRFQRQAEGYLRNPGRIQKLLNDADKKAKSSNNTSTSNDPSIWEQLWILIRLVKAAVSGEYKGVSKMTVISAVAVLIYFVSPLDLVPDFIPVIGLLDDFGLLAWFISSIPNEIDKFREWEKQKGSPPAAARPSENKADQQQGQSESKADQRC